MVYAVVCVCLAHILRTTDQTVAATIVAIGCSALPVLTYLATLEAPPKKRPPITDVGKKRLRIFAHGNDRELQMVTGGHLGRKLQGIQSSSWTELMAELRPSEFLYALVGTYDNLMLLWIPDGNELSHWRGRWNAALSASLEFYALPQEAHDRAH